MHGDHSSTNQIAGFNITEEEYQLKTIKKKCNMILNRCKKCLQQSDRLFLPPENPTTALAGL